MYLAVVYLFLVQTWSYSEQTYSSSANIDAMHDNISSMLYFLLMIGYSALVCTAAI